MRDNFTKLFVPTLVYELVRYFYVVFDLMLKCLSYYILCY